MSTDRQIKANRSNAQRSTGPRSAGGKAASSANARRHGLAGMLDETTVLSWYRVILEDDEAIPDPFEQDAYFRAAVELARAEAHLQRVRLAQEQWLLNPTMPPAQAEVELEDDRTMLEEVGSEFGWDRKSLKLMGQLASFLVRDRRRREVAGEAMGRTLLRYRASAEARRRTALRHWSSQIK